MPIPEFNEIKAPALQFFANGDGKPHKISEVFPVLAKHFGLTEEEQGGELEWLQVAGQWTHVLKG